METKPVVKLSGEPAIIINGLPKVSFDAVGSVQSEKANGSLADTDPYFGNWLEGRKVLKLFGDHYYYGTVTKYCDESNWYRVVYEDGDVEDLEWHELEDVLLPINISTPIKDLAIYMARTVSKSSEFQHMAHRSRRNLNRDVGSVSKTSAVIETPETACNQAEVPKVEENQISYPGRSADLTAALSLNGLEASEKQNESQWLGRLTARAEKHKRKQNVPA